MYCIYCGRHVPDDGVFCPYCGRRVVGALSTVEYLDDDAGFALSDAEYTKPEVIPVRENAVIDIPGDREKHSVGREYDADGKEEEESAEEGPEQPSVNQKKPKKQRLDKRILIIGTVAIILALSAIFLFKSFNILNNADDIIDIDESPEPKTGSDAVYTLRGDIAITVINKIDKFESVVYDTLGRKLHTLYIQAIPNYCRDSSSAILMNAYRYKYTHYIDASNTLELRKEADLAQITWDGSKIYYIVHGKIGSTLYSCDTESMTDKMLAVSVKKKISNLVVSPDGKTLAYTVVPEEVYAAGSSYDIRAESFILREGTQPEPFGTGRVIENISDNAGYVYYADVKPDSGELHLYVADEEGSTLLTKDRKNSTLYFNEDYSEVIISGRNSTHISISGGEPILLADTPTVMVLMPQNFITPNKDAFAGTTYGISTFTKAVLLGGDHTLSLIDRDYQLVKIGKLAPLNEVFSVFDNKYIFTGEAVISSDGDEVIYISDQQKLVKASGILSGKPEYETLSMIAFEFAVSDDFRHVYYSYNNELFYITNEGESVFIDENINNLVSSADGTSVFYRKNAQSDRGPLYSSFNGSPAQRVNEVNEVNEITRSDRAVLFRLLTNLKEDLFFNVKGVNVIPLFDER